MNIVEFFASLDIEKISKDEHEIIDKICKKIDVARVIKKSYETPSMSPNTDDVLDKHSLEIVVKKLINYYEHFHNYKVLNSLLKIADDILYEKHNKRISDSIKLSIQELNI